MKTLQQGNLHTDKQLKLLFKRCLDIIAAVVSLSLLIPVFIIIALVIKLTSRGSILFKHKRIGYLGREFELYKFRTMLQGAEDYKKYFSPGQLEEFNLNFKLKSDPRVTPVGRFLRSTSLDELPQFYNVLKGDIGIVGPRPVVKEELYKYGEYQKLLLSVKPGMTGLWQINGRSNTTYEERVKLDIEYIKNPGLLLDIKIILKTFIKVIRRDGVY